MFLTIRPNQVPNYQKEIRNACIIDNLVLIRNACIIDNLVLKQGGLITQVDGDIVGVVHKEPLHSHTTKFLTNYINYLEFRGSKLAGGRVSHWPVVTMLE